MPDFKLRSDLVCKFANLGFSGREISRAVEIKTGGSLKIDPDNVKVLVAQRRKRGQIRELTLEEKADIQRTTGNPFDYTDEIMDGDVRAILAVIKSLEETHEKLPQNRLELNKFRVSREIPTVNRKEGGVRVGNRIVYPDGTHVPTFARMNHTDKVKKGIRLRQLGQTKSEKTVEQMSVVYERIAPLCFRLPQLSPGEWSTMTEFTKSPLRSSQIKNAVSRKRTRWHSLPKGFYSSENIAERKRRGHKLAYPTRLRNPEGISKRENAKKEAEASQKMVAHFWEKGFFKWDLNTWNQIQKTYSDFKRPLPPDPLRLLIAEVYLEGVKRAIRGDSKLLREYKKIREELNPKSLSDTEQFVWAKFLTRWADGEDNKGFFRLDSNGSKFRQLVHEDGEYVYENSKIVIGRMRSRDLIGAGKNK